MAKITPADLASQTDAVLDRVAVLGETIDVEIGGSVIARIVPFQCGMTAAQAFKGLIPMLGKQQGIAWLHESRDGLDPEENDRMQ